MRHGEIHNPKEDQNATDHGRGQPGISENRGDEWSVANEELEMNDQDDNDLLQSDGEMDDGKTMAEGKEQELSGRRCERMDVQRIPCRWRRKRMSSKRMQRLADTLPM